MVRVRRHKSMIKKTQTSIIIFKPYKQILEFKRMKIYLFLFLFSLLFLTDSIAQHDYKDNLVSNISLYAGVYEGNLDVFLCCEGYETGFGIIVFYYDGESLKCLYDGLIYKFLSLSKNVFQYTDAYVEGQIFGKFVKDKDEGFLYFFDESGDHPAGTTSFLQKIGYNEMASKLYLEAEKELNDFKEFESIFRKAFENKREKEVLSMINLPFYDKREDWERPREYTKESDLKLLVKTMLKANLFENSSKYQNSNKDFGGEYTIQGNNMFFFFKKVGSEFKMVYITGVFG